MVFKQADLTRTSHYLTKGLIAFIGFLGLFFFLSISQPNIDAFAEAPTDSSATSQVTNVTIPQYQQNVSGTKEINLDNLDQMLNSKSSFILYIGYKECPFCREFSPTLNQFIKKTSATVYYLDLDDPTKVNLNSSAATFLKNDVKLSGTPTVVSVKNGTVDQSHNYVGVDTSEQDLESMIG
jgi:predicted bacteriocin transport accessory protein